MVRIAKISYYSNALQSEYDTCSCCGQGIRNVCRIETTDGEVLKFGTTCFGKLMKDRLDSFQRKKMRHALKMIRFWDDEAVKWLGMTEEKYCLEYADRPWENLEDINSFSEYREWYLGHFIPYRRTLAEEDLKKYRL